LINALEKLVDELNEAMKEHKKREETWTKLKEHVDANL
jgi:hypothetical protein